MILHRLILFSLFIVKFDCLKINGKDYHIEHNSENGVFTKIIYSKSSQGDTWVVQSRYNKTYLAIGWDTFDIETNPEIEDSEQAFLAGYLEGVETQSGIADHYYNSIPSMCRNTYQTDLCAKINEYLDTNTRWIKEMVEKYGVGDIYWRQVNLFYTQLAGLTLGYNHAAPAGENLGLKEMMWLNFNWDFADLMSAFKNEANKAEKGNSHCSALIKLLHGHSDILVSHNSWTGYETMRRIMKRYTFPFKQVVATSISFSGYPGILVSGDDFYTTNSGLVTLETTNENNNATLWAFVQPTGQVLEVIRATVANRLGDSGRSWTKIFSQYNSGTYNNQWMVVDMKKFSPGSMKSELLWVLEQMPGYIRREDQTDTLTRQGYWASYNVPFYPDIFNMSGNQELVKEYGDYFSHDKTSRALIFKRDQDKVVDIHTMMKLMRSNDFQHDPLSRCACSPPYSSENTIASRNDLNPANGTFPFPSLGHSASGAIDAKVTNYQLSKNLSILAVCGPTTGAHLPPFQWSKSDFNHNLSHRGHPDLFLFDPVLFSWPPQPRVY